VKHKFMNAQRPFKYSRLAIKYLKVFGMQSKMNNIIGWILN